MALRDKSLQVLASLSTTFAMHRRFTTVAPLVEYYLKGSRSVVVSEDVFDMAYFVHNAASKDTLGRLIEE